MRQEELIQRAMDMVCDMVIAYDLTGNIVYVNETARKSLEYPGDWKEIRVVDIFPGVFCYQSGVVRLERPLEDEMLVDIYRCNRTCFPVRLSILSWEDGTHICVAHDRTKELFLGRKMEQVEEEAKAASKVKSEFVANITHELRTPVNGILGNILALKEMEDDDEKCQILALVERGCGDMNAIINNILDFSKLEAGKFVVEHREFDFYGMMDYVKANHRRKIIEKGIQFTMSISPEIPQRIIGDELRIVQVLNNLLSNACKFTKVGRIAVEVVKTSQIGNRMELFFLVIDTGIGIRKEDQDKLFTSFSQVDASISRKYGGTGLGLNICKQLVELMDGSIHMESTEGQGSMFSFQIWVEIPESEIEEDTVADGTHAHTEIYTNTQPMIRSVTEFAADAGTISIRKYGSAENIEEINRDLSKLILSVEMKNWTKAEEFASALRELTMDAPQEIRSGILRLKMAVQKQDYETVNTQHEHVKKILSDG